MSGENLKEGIYHFYTVAVTAANSGNIKSTYEGLRALCKTISLV